ncbi:MAG TPA: TonB-dependent receptor plug domain-containing protein, partial [Gemmatimonadaceae bacterium]
MSVLCALHPIPVESQDSVRGERSVTSPRLVTLDLSDVPLREALKAVARQSGVSLIYASNTVPLERRVSLHVQAASVDAALRDALRETDAEPRETASGQVMLVKRSARPASERSERVLVGSISGRVIDSAGGTAVVRATVTVDGARRTTTDDDGRYRFADVRAGAHVVEIRRIGYAPISRSVMVSDGVASAADFVLTRVASQLEEVVMTVTGPQRRLEVGNAIGRIQADSVVRDAPVTSLSDLINARVPGTQVIIGNGLSGSTARVRIRGLNSVTVANDPLLIVDGARVENSATVFAGYGLSAGRINDLNPQEIESVEIVKGPSAATLYGTDAANGVMIVRTKRGRAGRTSWNMYAESGMIQQPARFLDNYYSWGHNTTSGAIQQCTLALSSTGTCVIDSLTTFNPLMYAETSPIGTGSRQQVGVQASGGVAQFTYFLGGQYEGETGFLRMPAKEEARVSAERGGAPIPAEQLRPNGLAKINVRGNAGAVLSPDADVNLSVGLISSETRLPGNAIFGAGSIGAGYRTAQDGWNGLYSRPGEIFSLRNTERTTHNMNSLTGTWRPSSWLSTRATGGFDFSSTQLDALQRRNEGPPGGGRNGQRINSRTNIGQYTADIGASGTFNPRSNLISRTSIGVQYNRRQLAVTTATGSNLAIGSETLTGAAVVSGTEQTLESVVAGAFAEQSLRFADRLFLTVAVRADGGSAFGRNFRTARYPKASLSWLVADQREGMLNSIRLRSAFGASGVQPGSTASLALIALAPALVDGVNVAGARLSAVGNPTLKPERQTELESGADLELANRRIRLEATYYDRLSRDALIDRPLSSEIGLTSRQENIGSVRNRGVEGLLSVTAIENKRLTWEVSFNGSINRNRLEEIGPGIPFIGAATYLRSIQGYPLFSRFARPILGFVDVNHNGIIEASEMQVGDTLVYVGQSFPPRQFTASSSLTLFGGDVRVATQFDYRGGNLLANLTELNRCASAFSSCRADNDPLAPLADQASAMGYNTPAFGRTFYGYFPDGSFMRWREFSLSYALPATTAGWLRAQTARVTVTGRNLRLFTAYPGVDPEVNAAIGFSDGY